MSAPENIGKRRDGNTNSDRTELTDVPASREKMEILREIGHVLAMSSEGAERAELLKELWRLYRAPPYLMVSRVNLDELEEPKGHWRIRWLGGEREKSITRK